MSTCLAVVSGEQARLLANVHIALLRLLQMDLEDAHATGAIQASLLVLFSCLWVVGKISTETVSLSCSSVDSSCKLTFSLLTVPSYKLQQTGTREAHVQG